MSGFMTALISALHILACVALMVAILLQSGKGGGLAGAFGAGSSQTLFGGRGAATFLSRGATALAVVFFLTSLTLGLSASHQTSATSRSLIQEDAKRRAQQRTSSEPNSPPPPSTDGATAPGGTSAPSSSPAAGMGTPISSQLQPPAPSTQTPAANAPKGGGTPQGNGAK